MNIQVASVLLQLAQAVGDSVVQAFSGDDARALPDYEEHINSVHAILVQQLFKIAETGNLQEESLLHPFLMETDIVWQAWATAIALTSNDPTDLVADYRIYTLAKQEALLHHKLMTDRQAKEHGHYLFVKFLRTVLNHLEFMATDLGDEYDA